MNYRKDTENADIFAMCCLASLKHTLHLLLSWCCVSKDVTLVGISNKAEHWCTVTLSNKMNCTCYHMRAIRRMKVNLCWENDNGCRYWDFLKKLLAWLSCWSCSSTTLFTLTATLVVKHCMQGGVNQTLWSVIWNKYAACKVEWSQNTP